MRDPDTFLVSRLRFKHLALVEALGSLHSIRKAARAMHISEPAVSKALAEIETSFGFALFERSAAGVVPTARGAAVIDGARLLLNSLRHVRRSAERAERHIAIRLGVAPFLAQSLLPRLLGAMRDGSRDVRIALREGPGPQLLKLLLDGELDAMLMAMSADVVDSQRSTALTYAPLYSERMRVIAPRGHPLVERRALAWAELTGEQWVLPAAPSVAESAIRNAFLAQGVVPPEPWIRSGTPATNVALASAGLGISAVPEPIALEARRIGSVAILEVSPEACLPPVSLVFHTAAAATATIRLVEHATRAVLPAVR